MEQQLKQQIEFEIISNSSFLVRNLNLSELNIKNKDALYVIRSCLKFRS